MDVFVYIMYIYTLMYLSNYKNNYSKGNFYAERCTYFKFWKLFT